MANQTEAHDKRQTVSSLLLAALAATALYGTLMTWRYAEARRELAVYQRGALSLLASRVQSGESDLLDAPNDAPSRYLNSEGTRLALIPPGQD